MFKIFNVKTWNNIDAYLTIAICAGLIGYNIFYSSNFYAISTGIFTVILLLATSIIRTRQTDIDIQDNLALLTSKVTPKASDFFTKWSSEEFKEMLDNHFKIVEPYLKQNTKRFPELEDRHPLNILDKESGQYKEALKEYRDSKKKKPAPKKTASTPKSVFGSPSFCITARVVVPVPTI